MTETERIVTKLSKDFHVLKKTVEGNGTIKGSILGRVDELELHCESANKRLVIVESHPCKDGCLFEVNEREEEDMNNRKRTFRIADIANYIQLAVLFLIVYGMFFV